MSKCDVASCAGGCLRLKDCRALKRLAECRENYLRAMWPSARQWPMFFGKPAALEGAPTPVAEGIRLCRLMRMGVCHHCGVFIGIAVRTHERYCDLSPQRQPVAVVLHDVEKAAKGECQCPGCIQQRQLGE